MDEKQYQPKDSGKLTNENYGTKKDNRKQHAITSEGTKDLEEVQKDNMK
ncbi:hypothetical protein [Aquibacillus rhizosphaerae]|uniref:YpzI family protein n=1 Tax=Aquibacillus rhizosphaerae TaxID=3051431 RepID=A0ABT7L5G3_9BACI|nr:hypothetical protein [Aquibacillus sp. LR5S19]MDL4840440.1 hypothetical protein [Aquibacillus sp. LR5S19]